MTMNLSTTTILSLLIALSLLNPTQGGPLAYGVCQSGCNAVVVACYAAAGCTFGTVTAGAGNDGVTIPLIDEIYAMTTILQ